MPGIIGKKLGMSQVIQDDGRVIPVTFIQCNPNEVVQVKTDEKDGYPAIVLGFDAYKNPTKNKKFKKVQEFCVDNVADYKKGQSISVAALKEVKTVTITAVSKGKGFQGVMKRHNFKGGPESHGSIHHREPGSIGCRAKPGRVLKGKRLPGHMGDNIVTLKDRPVVNVVPDMNVLVVKGSVPGATNSYISIKY